MSQLSALLARLRAGRIEDDKDIAAYPVDQTFIGSEPVRLGVRVDGHPMLLVPMVGTESSTDIDQAEGLEISVLKVMESGRVRMLELACRNESLESVFLDLVDNICGRIRAGGSAVDCTNAALEDFRNLLRSQSLTLGLEDIIGLFGELLAFNRLLEMGIDASEYWTGPSGGRHDFMLPDYSLEIKTSERQHIKSVTIHALDQLEVIDPQKLFLWFFSLERDPANGVGVSELIETIESKLPDKKAFQKALENAGWQVNSECDYLKWSVQVGQLYQIDDAFPKITPATFVGGKPAGVSHVEYRIDLDHARDSRVDESVLI